MPDPVTDANSASSTEGMPEPAPDQTITNTTVVADTTPPIQNLRGEWDRKFGKLERQLESLTQYLATAQPSKATTQQNHDVTDEDLWRLAQQGDRTAFDMYMTRIAAKTGQVQNQALRREALIDAQLAAINQKYPVFNDTSHALTQTAQTAYQLLVQQGYQPGKVTLLEAIKTAIADRPDLVSEIHQAGTVAREGIRRSATTVAQAGQTGVTHREASPPPGSRVKALTKDEVALAKRMGIKDPMKSKERFLARQESGQSSLGAVSGYVHEEDL